MNMKKSIMLVLVFSLVLIGTSCTDIYSTDSLTKEYSDLVQEYDKLVQEYSDSVQEYSDSVQERND